jgi:hypothetical protein
MTMKKKGNAIDWNAVETSIAKKNEIEARATEQEKKEQALIKAKNKERTQHIQQNKAIQRRLIKQRKAEEEANGYVAPMTAEQQIRNAKCNAATAKGTIQQIDHQDRNAMLDQALYSMGLAAKGTPVTEEKKKRGKK